MTADQLHAINLDPNKDKSSIPHLTFISKDESIWITSTTGGLHPFRKDGKSLSQGKKLYERFNFSAFLEDYEGNYWFATKKKGILYIITPEITSYINHPLLKEESFTHVRYDKHGNVYLMSTVGVIYKITQIAYSSDKYLRFLVALMVL